MQILHDFQFSFQPLQHVRYNSKFCIVTLFACILLIYFVEDGEYAMHTVSNRVELWNASTGKVVSNYTPLGNGRNVLCLDVTEDSAKLAFGAEDRAVTYYDVLESKFLVGTVSCIKLFSNTLFCQINGQLVK